VGTPPPPPGADATGTAQSSSSSAATETTDPPTTTTMDGPSSADGSAGSTTCSPQDGCECTPSEHEPCDQGADSMIAAFGLDCPGDAQVEVLTFGNPGAMSVRTGLGPTSEWAPREGSAFAVLGTGFTTDLDLETPTGDSDAGPTHCNDDLGPEYDLGMTLPLPIQPMDVDGDCTTNTMLLGTGDCSSTIEDQLGQDGTVEDYTELRIWAEVPAGKTSLAFDFAYFSTEYPFYVGSTFNDMYMSWLESERWTGNISFDETGNAISLDSGFLDVRDDDGTLPELQGTCMRQHAGTPWLHTVAPVAPGETIILVLAIFDLSDSILDSYVFLDGFGWGCDAVDEPSTAPSG
jgi:hypothetical protein